jgi:hypothetical protein
LETEKIVSISATGAAKPKPAASQSPGVVVELIDGSTVLARQYTTKKEVAKITLPGGDVLEMPTNVIRNVRLQSSGTSAAEWTRLIDTKTDGDLLVIGKNETIDYHQGVLHDVTEETVQFELDGELLPIKRAKIYGIAYHHSEKNAMPPTICKITDATGSQWEVRSLAGTEKLEWTTPSGVRVAQSLDHIAQIDFSGGKRVYLSDLKPDMMRWTPYFESGKPASAMERFYAPRFDRNFDAKPLQLGGVSYHKGIALHSRTEIVFRLSDRFSRFRATVGIDDAVRPNGKVRLVVRGEEQSLFDAIITGGDAPKPLDLDISQTRRLTIVVDFADGLHAGDSLLLCNARLSK